MQPGVAEYPKLKTMYDGIKFVHCYIWAVRWHFCTSHHFEKCLRHVIHPSSTINQRHVLCSSYLLPIVDSFPSVCMLNQTDFVGVKVPEVGFLIPKDSNNILDHKYQTKLPRVVGWNWIWLGYSALTKEYDPSLILSSVQKGSPLLLSQLCAYYYTDVCKAQTFGIRVEKKANMKGSADLSKKVKFPLASRDF